MLIRCMAVGMGGFLGSVARYLIYQINFQRGGKYPVNTLLVNVVGAVLIGIIIAESEHSGLSESKLLFLKFGLCGGLTTFSTFSAEMYGYIESGNILLAAGYALFSVTVCLFGVMIGMRLA